MLAQVTWLLRDVGSAARKTPATSAGPRAGLIVAAWTITNLELQGQQMTANEYAMQKMNFKVDERSGRQPVECCGIPRRSLQNAQRAHEKMVRLYVGGLAEDITAEQLSQRFQGFGRVGDCEVVAPKANDTFRLPTASCRGFGYVDLDLPDEAALRKIVSVVRLHS